MHFFRYLFMDLVIYFKGTSTVCLSILVGITLFIEVFLCWDLTFSFFISLEIVLNWKLSSFIFQDISRLFYFEGNDVIITALNYRLDIICFIERWWFQVQTFYYTDKKVYSSYLLFFFISYISITFNKRYSTGTISFILKYRRKNWQNIFIFMDILKIQLTIINFFFVKDFLRTEK